MEHPDEYTFAPEDVERAARFTLEETEGGWLFVDEDGTARVLVPPRKTRKRNGEQRENMASYPADEWAVWLQVLEVLARSAEPGLIG